MVGKPTSAAAEITPTPSTTKAPSTPTRRIRPLPKRRTVFLIYSSGVLDPALLMSFALLSATRLSPVLRDQGFAPPALRRVCLFVGKCYNFTTGTL